MATPPASIGDDVFPPAPLPPYISIRDDDDNDVGGLESAPCVGPVLGSALPAGVVHLGEGTRRYLQRRRTAIISLRR